MEFGCGLAHNLVYFAKKMGAELIGLDWAHSSQKIIDCIRGKPCLQCRGIQFCFGFDENLEIDDGTIIVTIGALEQIHKDWENVVNYWIRSKPTHGCST